MLDGGFNMKITMTATQVEACKVLLRKVAPDLSTVAVGQDDSLGPIQVSWLDK